MASQVCAIDRSCHQSTRFAVAATHPPPLGEHDPRQSAAPCVVHRGWHARPLLVGFVAED